METYDFKRDEAAVTSLLEARIVPRYLAEKLCDESIPKLASDVANRLLRGRLCYEEA